VTGDFRIGVEWLDDSTLPRTDPTAAWLRIAVGPEVATRAENRWSQTVIEAVPLSAEPLASWFASSWWRLRWEPEWPGRQPPLSWRMAHEVGAAGEGFLWPRLRVTSEGDHLQFDCVPTRSGSGERLSYLADFRVRVPAETYEQEVDRFVALVIERIGARGSAAELNDLWRDVLDERADPQRAEYRRLEAILGHDPDEAAPEFLERVRALGEAAEDPDDIAALCAVSSPEAVKQAADGANVQGRLQVGLVSPPGDSHMVPHERGYALARQLRGYCGLNQSARVNIDTLADLSGVSVPDLTGSPSFPRAPMALANREEAGHRFLFRNSRNDGRRFEVARLIGDVLAVPRAWQIATSTRTARQKLQRAFATEFLAPIDGVSEFLSDDLSDEAVSATAEHFQVSDLVIRHQIENHDPGGRNSWNRVA
jgi:hypothetical protein